MAMAGPLSSGGCEIGFALQSILEVPQRDAACSGGRYGRFDEPAARPASEALAVVSLVGHHSSMRFSTYPLPKRQEIHTRGLHRPGCTNCIAYTRRRPGFRARRLLILPAAAAVPTPVGADRPLVRRLRTR